ncbi:MAG: hypothetical protein JKY88_02810 [Pseudomonadales bacterium]|nr:hypothetical protein [Pseudomonadales bacterium]
MASTKVLDNVADTTASGDITISHDACIIICTAGSVNVQFDSTTIKAISSGEGYVFDVSPGDKLDVIASSASTTAWLGPRGRWTETLSQGAS